MSKRNNKHRYREVNDVVAAIEKPEQRKQSPIKYILDQQKLRTRQDLLKLRLAVDTCENVMNYNREMLHNIYRDIEKDLNLSSNWNSRKMKVKQRPKKMVNAAGEENKDLTKIFEAPWFVEWIDAVLDHHMWDFSLIEFGPLQEGCFKPYEVNGKMYDAVTVIDRDNVKPELGIITNTPGDSTGIKFSDPRFSDYLMFVGSHRKRNGILWKAAKYILFKDNCLGNWSEWAEVFGMDKRIGKTAAVDTPGNPQRTNFMRALRDLGSNAYGVFGTDDEVEYIGTQRSDAFKVYHEFVKYIDEQTAKEVFGQDVVSNNTGRVVGSVGENVANMYGDSDAAEIEYLVNTKLIPMMETLGFSFDGHKFMWDTTERLPLAERAKVDASISKDMGMDIDQTYIAETYGVPVTKKEIPDTPAAPNYGG
jgi:hypothetical protein